MAYRFGICDREPFCNALAIVYCLILLAIGNIILSFNLVNSPPSSGQEILSLFESWVVKHDRQYDYDNNITEKQRRLEIFIDNLRFITQHNSFRNKTYKLGLNRFADLTNEEYRSMFLGGKMVKLNTTSHRFKYNDTNVDELPECIDWRDRGAVAPVKDQDPCAGSSWAFSTVGAVEGINHIVTGELIHLSEQELIDCDTGFNHGCSSRGDPVTYAFEFIVKNGGIHTQTYYPYWGGDGQCEQDMVKNSKVVTLDGYENVPPNDEISLKKAVAHQPVSVAIEAGGRAFQLYESGVFTGLCGTDLEHGVVVVGYGTKGGIDYWIVRNSWGPWWGENGYIRLERNLGSSNSGRCGIAMLPSYPTKTAGPVTKTTPQQSKGSPIGIAMLPSYPTKTSEPVTKTTPQQSKGSPIGIAMLPSYPTKTSEPVTKTTPQQSKGSPIGIAMLPSYPTKTSEPVTKTTPQQSKGSASSCNTQMDCNECC